MTVTSHQALRDVAFGPRPASLTNSANDRRAPILSSVMLRARTRAMGLRTSTTCVPVVTATR